MYLHRACAESVCFGVTVHLFFFAAVWRKNPRVLVQASSVILSSENTFPFFLIFSTFTNIFCIAVFENFASVAILVLLETLFV